MRSAPAAAGLLLFFSIYPCDAQELAPEILLERIQAKMADKLRRLPNYTCTEIIERSQRLRSGVWERVDTQRLEVALVDGKELFARPGAPKFDEKEIGDIVGSPGMIGSGDFGQFAISVFLTDSPTFTYAGERLLAGRASLGFHYHVPVSTSNYTLRVGARQARVAYHGSFWVDARTLDLIRLETAVDEIPPDLRLAHATDATDYQQTRIGASDFLLPATSELVMIDLAGHENRNRMRLSACRQYTAASAISFQEPIPSSNKPAPNPPAAKPAVNADVTKAAEQELPPGILLLARIKARAAENLRRLPNYTCTQTIERSHRNARQRKFEPVDTLRLEVALVEGKELFSWPGAGKFEEKGIGEIVGGGGAIGNGSFALHARSVFLSHAPTFKYVGETTLNGRRAIRYDYRVPQMLSGYQIKIGPNQALVEYHGSFWVDAGTLDLIRLEVLADNPPPNLNLAEASDTMEYQRAHIGDSDFLLPQSSELVMTDLLGNANRNRTQLGACRQYAGESKLSFVEPSPDAAAPSPTPQVKPIRLPAGVTVEVRLQTPIQSGRSAIGDPVKALVGRDVKKDGEILAPKGAVLTGRITRLEKRKGEQDYYIVGLEFSTIEFDNRTGEFRATLQDAGLAQYSRGGPGRQAGRRQMMDNDIPDATPATGSVFVVRSSHFSLPRGHSMLWRTQLWGTELWRTQE